MFWMRILKRYILDQINGCKKNSFGCAIDRALSTSVQNSLDINLTQIGLNLRLRLNFALISSQVSPWT